MRFWTILGLNILWAIGFLAAQATPFELVREQRQVRVGDATETWQLIWEAKPSSVCGPEEVDMAITCPCSGWAYGQYGKLALKRLRKGREVERIELAPFFGQFDYPYADKLKGTAYIQRWPMKDDDFDRENRGDKTLIADIERRPTTELMKLADYDHDGNATEFLLQVGTMPCGKLQFAAFGVSPNDPHLHALSSAAHPNQPLFMPMDAWNALLKSNKPTEVPTWACGDHGSDEKDTLIIYADHGVIHVKQREYSCPENGSPGKLVKETDG